MKDNKVAQAGENQTRSDLLANEKISKLLWRLSIPAIIGMMVQGMYNIVDTFFVSRYTGTLGLGGTAVAFPIQMILTGIGISVGIGGASMLSRRLGERNREGASLALGNMITLSVVMGIITMIAGLVVMEPMLRAFGANDKLMPYASDYIVVILFGSPFLIFSTVASSAARAEGNAKVAMFTLVIGGVLNVLLDPIFIILLEMGVMGAAIATVISIFVSCLFLLWYLLSGKSEVVLKPRHLLMKLAIVGEIFAVGASDFARTAAMSFTSMIFNTILSGYADGAVPIATFGIIFRIISFVFMPMIGLAQGAQPIIGFNYGARQYKRIRACLSLANKSATVISCIGFLVFMIFPAPILRIFSTDEALIEMGTTAMRFLVLGFPLIGYQNIGSGLFQAIGKAWQAIFLAFSRQVLFLIPFVYLLSWWLGLQGVWLSFPVSDLVAFIVTMIMVVKEMRVLMRLDVGTPEPEGSKLL